MANVIRSPLTGLALLAGAAGGPYMLFETDTGKLAQESASHVFSSTSTSSDKPGPGEAAYHWNLAGTNPSPTALNPSTAEHHLEQPPVPNLSEVLRFDITPTWVMNRFPRVSTVLADMQLDGLRVPLVTGIAPTDLAGTLTYYFDHNQRLQRVTIHSVTGDPTRFVSELQSAYRFQQEPSLGGGLYLLKWNNQPTCILHVTPAPVIYSDAPYSRFSLFLEVNQPGIAYGLSKEAQLLISTGKETNRW